MQALTIIQWIGSQEYWTCSISLSLICKACSSSAFLRSRSCSLPSSLSLLKWLFVFLDTFSSNTDSRCGEGSTNPKIFGITGPAWRPGLFKQKQKLKEREQAILILKFLQFGRDKRFSDSSDDHSCLKLLRAFDSIIFLSLWNYLSFSQGFWKIRDQLQFSLSRPIVSLEA